MPDTVLGAENTIMNKADKSPSFVEINSNERKEVDRVTGQRRLEKGTFDQTAIEVRKQAMRISGGKAFQEEEETSTKVLKYLHIQRWRPASEEKGIE